VETKSSHVLVGAVVLALTAALFAFVLWLARFDRDAAKSYDIFFQSVSGLASGSAVTYSGVPVGQVDRIALMPDTPEFIRVRISVAENVPVLQGTTATIQGVGFTGVSIVQLEGGLKGAPPLTEEGPFGVPVIPTRPGALGQLLSTAPELLERASILLARLNTLFDTENQASIAAILKNVSRLTDELSERGPEISATLNAAQKAVSQAGDASERLGLLAQTTDQLLATEGRPLIAELRTSVTQAGNAMAELEKVAANARPGIDSFTTRTLPEVGQLVRDLRSLSGSLRAIASRVEDNPAGALAGSRRLPDYEPANPPEAAPAD
jgi:phospholipid/cholesterol/gamma-HCH transport system substrate-binding protein